MAAGATKVVRILLIVPCRSSRSAKTTIEGTITGRDTGAIIYPLAPSSAASVRSSTRSPSVLSLAFSTRSINTATMTTTTTTTESKPKPNNSCPSASQ
ncbi:hypothetical protein DFJ43DRAFT_1059778 [Lentinula guzmanii]|uniref:Uncharacterized protein n=1 Tax=Lentinula guzmanii TaxID=2804957 RepID=A0AA38JS12_9AGAR|nr:hypothetical protein DFJ43DRAFT_1059778 [Lentinula guzmanii]